MAAYDNYIDQRTAWVKSRMTTPWPGWGVAGGDDAAMNAYRAEEKALGDQWFEQLPPDQKTAVSQAFEGKAADTAQINKWGSLAAKGIVGAAAGGAALGALGGTGAAAGGSASGLTGVDAAMADLAASGGLQASSFAPAVAGAGAAGAGAAGAGAAGAGGGLLGGTGGTVGSMLGGLSGSDWASILAGGAGLANSLKDPATAATPDYMSLAKLQAQLEQEAADKALSANRPDQVDAAGNTLKWTQDPTTGKWTQTQTLSQGNQALLDTSQKSQLDALRGVAGRGEFDYQGPGLMSPTGNSADIQNAWMALLKPERDISRGNEIQRLKNQGLSEDSPAFQRAMLRLDQGDTDAQNKALIAGTSEYGNQFNRSLQGRQQGFGEYQTDYNAPMQQYQGLMGIAAPSGNFGNFTNAQNAGGANVYGAGQDQYAANTANANAKNAASNNLTQGLFGLSGAIAKGGWGG